MKDEDEFGGYLRIHEPFAVEELARECLSCWRLLVEGNFLNSTTVVYLSHSPFGGRTVVEMEPEQMCADFDDTALFEGHVFQGPKTAAEMLEWLECLQPWLAERAKAKSNKGPETAEPPH